MRQLGWCHVAAAGCLPHGLSFPPTCPHGYTAREGLSKAYFEPQARLLHALGVLSYGTVHYIRPLPLSSFCISPHFFHSPNSLITQSLTQIIHEKSLRPYLMSDISFSRNIQFPKLFTIQNFPTKYNVLDLHITCSFSPFPIQSTHSLSLYSILRTDIWTSKGNCLQIPSLCPY